MSISGVAARDEALALQFPEWETRASPPYFFACLYVPVISEKTGLSVSSSLLFSSEIDELNDYQDHGTKTDYLVGLAR